MKACLTLGIIAILIPFATSAQCVAPAVPPDPPNGATATREEMVAAQNVIKSYNAAVMEYTGCVKQTAGNPDRANDIIGRLEKLADRFNAELRVFKQRSGG